MPQMFPMDWLNQYIYFMIIFYLIILLNYYSIMNLKLNKFIKLNKTNKILSWKW
uniref:ATP synthase complex subunit 8 n=1 Tax=Labriocimbex sinicus TaxID=2358206 RepID=A0A4P2UJF5_9HYME|nr:ATP synthase F0 subunit 8 [Labriocimbex sinicus]AYC21404.1 ATP synthase F0 subunit 8 [Labriocimbex sinicus]